MQYPIINRKGKEGEKKYTFIKLNHFAIHQKLTQHCKSTILQHIFLMHSLLCISITANISRK